MKKVIKLVDETRGTVQITTVDERWYALESKDLVTGLPVYRYVPSVTWIADHYPKGVAFFKWLADKGWDEAEALKSAAGDKGSKVHAAIVDLLAGLEVKINDQYMNHSKGVMEELSEEEYYTLMTFANWHAAMQPELLAQDFVVISDAGNYAGTVDFVFRDKNGNVWLTDFKTGQHIWPSYALQISAYKNALLEMGKDEFVWIPDEPIQLAILQLGYRYNERGWKFTPIEDAMNLFNAAKLIWANETKGQKPKQKDYPLVLQLTKSEEPKQDAPTSKTRKSGGNKQR